MNLTVENPMPKYISDTEHKILRKLLEVARAHHFAPVCVDDGGDDVEVTTEDTDVIEAVDAVEYAVIHFKRLPTLTTDAATFSATVILGNGTDLINDYSAASMDFENVDLFMHEVQDYAESLGV